MASRANLVAELAGLIRSVAQGGVSAPEVAAELRRIAAGLEAIVLPTKRTVARATAIEVAAFGRVFARWREVCDHPTAKATAGRKRKVLARLREGYTETDLLAAIEGCALSAYHMGENDTQTRYDGLEQICHSGDKVERFRRIYEDHGGGPAASTEEDPRIARKTAEAEKALAEGRIEDYERLVAEIDALRGRE
jgi:hypothetical protein